MHEFDKCNFCTSWQEGCCYDMYCKDHSDYVLDVNKIFAKADERGVSVTDILNLIRECNPKRVRPVDMYDPFMVQFPYYDYSTGNSVIGETYIHTAEKPDWDVMDCED